jgi:hypothetical protein
MRKTLAVIVFSLWTLMSVVAEEKGDSPKFKSYTAPYFEKNNSGLKGDASYLVVQDQKAFDATFGIGRTMRKPPEMLPANAFDKHLVVAVIKRGNAITTYKVDTVKVKDGVVTVSYKAEMGEASTAKFASPLIISIDNGIYKSVQFVENGKAVKTLEIVADGTGAKKPLEIEK